MAMNPLSPPDQSTPNPETRAKASYGLYRHAIANRFSQILCKLLALKDHQPLILVRLVSFALDDAWVGRESLIRDLSDRIQDSCRLMILVGITGIGKTALGERLAVELEDWFSGDWTKFHQEILMMSSNLQILPVLLLVGWRNGVN